MASLLACYQNICFLLSWTYNTCTLKNVTKKNGFNPYSFSDFSLNPIVLFPKKEYYYILLNLTWFIVPFPSSPHRTTHPSRPMSWTIGLTTTWLWIVSFSFALLWLMWTQLRRIVLSDRKVQDIVLSFNICIIKLKTSSAAINIHYV